MSAPEDQQLIKLILHLRYKGIPIQRIATEVLTQYNAKQKLEVLKQYGEHKSGCDYFHGEKEFACSCGLGLLKVELEAVAYPENVKPKL